MTKGGHIYLLSVSFTNHYIEFNGPTLLQVSSLEGVGSCLVGNI